MTHLNSDAISARLQQKRMERGLTVDQAAARCDMPVTTLELYLYRRSLPGANALAKLARGLGVSVDWLLFGDGPHDA